MNHHHKKKVEKKQVIKLDFCLICRKEPSPQGCRTASDPGSHCWPPSSALASGPLHLLCPLTGRLLLFLPHGWLLLTVQAPAKMPLPQKVPLKITGAPPQKHQSRSALPTPCYSTSGTSLASQYSLLLWPICPPVRVIHGACISLLGTSSSPHSPP
jgi:hypothetical protein